MAVYTDQITSELENRDIDMPTHTFGTVDAGQSDYQHDAAVQLTVDPVRWWYYKVCTCGPNTICMHDNRHYYMFGSSIYVSYKIREEVYTAIEPTVYEKTVLDLVEDPGSLRDILLSRPPAVKGILF